MVENPARRLVAVMFTDMAGYTALMQADETRAVAKRNLYVGALERAHEAAGGTIVQRLGDGSLSMFPSALAAVEAAVAMQRDLAPADVPVRIGIHVGDVLVEPERLTGDAVNVAARVESFAVSRIRLRLGHGVRAGPEPAGARSRAARVVPPQERRPATRSVCGRRRRPRRPRPVGRSRGRARRSSRSARRCRSPSSALLGRDRELAELARPRPASIGW